MLFEQAAYFRDCRLDLYLADFVLLSPQRAIILDLTFFELRFAANPWILLGFAFVECDD